MLLRLLAAPRLCVSLGGNHVKLPRHPDARNLVQAFDAANRQVWDRKASFKEQAAGRVRWRETLDTILTSEAFVGRSHFFFHRSFPFAQPRDQYAPDLWDVVKLRPDAKIIVIYRDPCASSYSAFRRKFDPDLRRLAVICSEQLTWLAAQVQALGPQNIRRVSYQALCADPGAVLASLAEFCEVPPAEVTAAADAEGIVATTDTRWKRELDPEDAAWLEQYFDASRRRQWAVLANESAT